MPGLLHRRRIILPGGGGLPAPSFTAQPSGGLADASTGQITLSIAADNASSYQWQSWNGSTWSNVTDETDTSLVLTPSAGGVYSCVATGAGGSTRSDAVNVAPYPRLLTGYRMAADDPGSLGITGAFSMSRDIVDGFSSSRYTDAGGGAISAWIDQSGGAGNFAQATAGNRAVAATNNRTLADFDGTDDYFLHAANSSAIFGAAESYIATCIIIDSKDWDVGVDPYDNDLIFADDGGNIAVGYKSGPGSGSFTFLYARWGTAQVNANPGLVVTDANAFGQIATVEYRSDGATVGVRVGGAVSVTAWDEETAAGNFDFGSNTFTMAGLAGSDGAQIRAYEAVFANALMPDTMQDALRSAMRAWATGSAGSPWLTTLPDWGQPWNGLTLLDTAFAFGGLSGCEAQYDETNGAVGRAFILSAANPDWLQAGRFELRAGDDWNTTERTEVQTTVTLANTETVWVSGKFKIDSATGTDKALILQFHAASTPPEDVDGTSAVLAFRYNWATAGNLLVETQLSTTTPASGGQANTVHYDTACAKDAWHDYVIQWRPDPTGADALLKVWLNGTLIVDATTASGFSAADSYYMKFGAYNGSANTVNPFIVWHAAIEAGSSSLSSRITNPKRDPA